MSTFGRGPDVSVIVICYNAAREAPRTLRSLSAGYQRDVAPDDFEIIVVDNGSDVPFDPTVTAELSGNFRHIRVEPGWPSPAYAINRGLEAARGDVVGVMIDGARIATPGLLHFARHGARLYDKAVVATLGWYLGYDLQGWSALLGYDRAREDALLESIEWPADGYRLFEIATMDESSVDGWFQPVAESNAIFARREMWAAIGGVDERFDLPGGGLLNLDTYARLLDVPGTELVIPLGEATFHQVHGGISTNASPQRQATNFAAWAAQYAAIRGHAFELGSRQKPPAYIGTLPQAVLGRFVRSALRPAKRGWTSPLGAGFREDLWTNGALAGSGAEPIARVVEVGRAAFRAGQFEASCAVARLVAERAPEEPGLRHVLALVAPTLTSDGPPPERGAEYYLALGDAHATLGETEAAATHYRLALTFTPDVPLAHVALSRLRMPGEEYLECLERLYAELEPASLIEIGVYEGASLALARPPTIAIGVDPEARMLTPPRTETHIFAETSDTFFELGRARTLLGGRPLSIGFIDGLHVFEQALRDFIGFEALCGPDSLIIMHDTVPLDEPTQTRERRTGFHTGDVWKVVLCLKHYRPDLDIFTIATAPTGLTVVQGLDPSSSVLASAYDEAVARFIEVPFSSIERDLAAHVNLVPNQWEQVRSRLRGARHSLSRSEAHG